jgi:hypothetical protein
LGRFQIRNVETEEAIGITGNKACLLLLLLLLLLLCSISAIRM